MPFAVTPFELAQIRNDHRATMIDRCRIVRTSGGMDDYNERTLTYTPDAEQTPCGFNPQGGQFQLADTRIALYSGEFRLPLDTNLDMLGGFILEYQGDHPIPPRSYEIAEPPRIGRTAILVKVQSVTDQRF